MLVKDDAAVVQGDVRELRPAVDIAQGEDVRSTGTQILGPQGIRLDALAGLEWIGFPRSGSPAWYDELTATLRSHGIAVGPTPPDGQTLIAEVKLAAVSAGRAFTLAPPDWSQPLPDTVTWLPLVGHPLVRRTWAVWDAGSHRRDLGHLLAALDFRGPN
ncbi:LysR substrate-binding domain-containing protein [Streptomyces sp. NBC_01003]|uniref:LysR substrate-binding domain-containing protein n=1 Tax=Streptomyces sp. NBC_01003 TaxID=2903714 RepID=UPI003868176E|nr:LysR substrate-binding domain-containing protein [Streptomyces sp. NBC_01003]